MEAAVRRCSVKKMFLKISQNSQENTCARVSLLIKFQAWDLHRCFPVNFLKFSRTPFFIEHLRWLLPIIWKPSKKQHLFILKYYSKSFYSWCGKIIFVLYFIKISCNLFYFWLRKSISWSIKFFSDLLYFLFRKACFWSWITKYFFLIHL